MKKRLLSFVLCVVMVFSLLPMFGAPALAADGVETADGFAQAGTRTSWKMSDVQDWTAHYNTYAPYADDGRLYVKVGENDYREVVIASDPNYYENGTTTRTLSGSFLAGMTSTQGDYFWEQDNSQFAFKDANGIYHQLYYNTYCAYYRDDITTLWTTHSIYHIEAYYYADPTDQGVNTKGTTSDDETANNNFQAAVDSGRIVLVDKNGNPTTTRWSLAYTQRESMPSGKSNTLTGVYDVRTANNKYAMYYDGANNTPVYMVRNATGSANPSNTAWSGKLYYKVDENMIIDPETVEVLDDDPGESTVTVQDHNTITNPPRANENGLKLSKALAYNGTSEAFDLTMEAYSTVNVDKTNVTEKIPTDFVIVVDQSGSMDYVDMPVSYDKTIKMVELETIAAAAEADVGSSAANGYYYKADDGNYYRVYPVKDYLFHYYPANHWFVGDIVERYGEDLSWFQGSEDTEADYANLMYFRDGQDAEGRGYYQPITMTTRGSFLTYYIKFRYTPHAGGNAVYFNREEESYIGGNSPWYKNFLNGNIISPGWGIWPVNYDNIDSIVQGLWTGDDTCYTFSEAAGIRTGMYVNYPMYERKVGYTKLAYRDVNGVEHIVPSASGVTETEYCDASGNATTTKEATTRMWYNNLYTYHKATNTSRVTALKGALNQFLTAVANEKDTKNKAISSVDNRIAIVGFADAGRNTTEVMTGESINAGGGVSKTTADNNPGTYYGGALLSATDNGQLGVVNPKLTAAVNSITANGGTQPELGLNMAYQILNRRSVTDYTMVTGDQDTVKRNTIVIFFTDGRPGDYHYSNQYAEANEVVQAALNIKNLQSGGVDLNTTVFSIGVFGESDGNPLTYNETNLVSPYNNRNFWPYMGGWVETYQSGGSYYCLRRQWRAHNADYTADANDTIFDYMSVVSSNYPDAENYIAPAWLAGNFNGNYVGATEGVRHINTAESTNKYYRMASNQDTLVRAFREAVTIASSIAEGSSGATTLDDMTLFQDKIDTENFDVSNATYSVWWQPIHVLDNAVSTDYGSTMVADNGSPVLKVDHQPVPDSGVINYTGFNYSEHYVSKLKDQGYKLVVKVEGLVPLKYNQPMNSNADAGTTADPVYACGIYPNGSDEARISVKSPIVTVFKVKSAYVADFNAPLIIATEATKLSAEKNGASVSTLEGTNGTFSLRDQNAVYQLNCGTLTEKNKAVNIAYADADSAWITGKHAEDGEGAPASQQEVVVIPGSSVYYDDDLKNGSAIAIGDGSGYNAAVSETHATTDLAKGVYTFTFYGTGIDVYCTTAHDGGMIQAKLEDGQTQSVRNYTEETTRYNVPTVSFRDLAPGVQHTLTLNVLGSSNYKLDGIRVYNPMADQTQYAETDEQYATFINLREVMINNGLSSTDPVSVTEVGEDDYAAVFGALFVDDVSKMALSEDVTHDDGTVETVTHYTNVFEAYQKNSPKHEIYLDQNQAVTFQLTEAAQSGKLWIGLSAPDASVSFNNAKVTINGKTFAVTSGVDMYYPITDEMVEGGASSIMITNSGSAMISITNLKITGVESIYNAANAPKATTSSVNDGAAVLALEDVVPLVFEPVTLKTVRMAVSGGFDPADQAEPEVPDTPAEPDPTPSPDPTPDPTSGPQSWISQLISNFVSMLFRSIARLFGN